MGGDCRLRNKSFFCVFSNDSIVHSMWGGGGTEGKQEKTLESA